MDLEIIATGAESTIYKTKDTVIKYRTPKLYRISEIDTLLTRRRTKREKKILLHLKKAGVCVPEILKHEHPLPQESSICMENIEGRLVRDCEMDSNLLFLLGKIIRRIHDCGVVHGDPTTANFILKGSGEVFVIDFGLAVFTRKDEDRAVDLYVFERAVACGHGSIDLSMFFSGYGEAAVIKKLEEVRRRGRKREENAFG